MVMFGVMTALALSIVGICSWWWLRRASRPSSARLAAAAGALWLTSLAATLAGRATLAPTAPLPESGAAIAWPVPPKSPLVSSSGLPKAAAAQVGSVESMVTGLEARLEANPNDSEGWALLAQSYAYTANEEAVEGAFERAVALGFDAASLRERVDSAKRSAPTFDWVDRAIGASAR
jgi:cytochrome c-type biogenesis protein CcmH/NrfG